MSSKNKKFSYQTSNHQNNELKHILVPIKGMHCRSCEILISEKLREIQGVKNVQVSYKNSNANIHHSNEVDIEQIKRAVSEAGYEVGSNEAKPWITEDPAAFKDLFFSALLLLFLYFVVSKLGIASISVGSGNPSSLLVVLIIGLTAGISTCMALVGGLVLGISARHSEKHPKASSIQKFRPHLFFNVGRIASYFLLGGLIGLIGKAFQLSGPVLGTLMILVGIIMFILGVQLTEVFPRVSSGGITLPSSISKFLGIKNKHEREYSHTNSLMVGALTFFLPCGFTQAMQLYAMSTGNFWLGAAIMGTFAIGTAPGLLSIGGLISILKGNFAKKFYKFTGLLVIFLAMFNISNGYNLTGVSIGRQKDQTQAEKSDPNVTVENGVQVVKMDQVGGGYRPNQFTIRKGVPVRWVINSKKPDACSASILASKIGVRKILTAGENVIEFTPSEAGEIKFSCLMGMYTGKFNVVDGPGSDSSQPQAQGDSMPKEQKRTEPKKADPSNVQIIKTIYLSPEEDISPNQFTVNVNQPVKFVVDSLEDGEGCMGSITIPGLTNDVDFFQKGKTITFDFTPTKKGTYQITCGMGVPHGVIKVV